MRATRIQGSLANLILGLLLFVGLLLVTSAAHGRIEIKDGKRREFPEASSRTNSDGISLRKERRVAIGASAAGPLGVLGANLELNFTPRWGIMAGYGTGFTYQTWTFQIKRVLAGEYLLPYLAGGISRWYTTTPGRDPISKDVQPGYIERFLSETEKEKGEFSQILLYPAFGLQFMQLTGDYAGLSVFAEILMLLDVGDFEAVPTGTVGMLYYF